MGYPSSFQYQRRVRCRSLNSSLFVHHAVTEQALIEKVTEKRARDARTEIREHYPEATVSYEVCGGRGIITVLIDRFIVSKEFVETEDSLSDTHRLVEYARVLQGKSRLVVLVPKHNAVRTRLRLLELNNWWLCYYQLHYYDENGDIKRVDRRTWRRMRGLPPDEPELPREVA